jgi:hypothetical protein
MLVRNLLLADAYQVQIIARRLHERHHRELIPYLKKVGTLSHTLRARSCLVTLAASQELSGNLERALVTYVETCLRP